MNQPICRITRLIELIKHHAAVAALVVVLVAAGARPEAVAASQLQTAQTTPNVEAYSLSGYVWPARSIIPVYSNWSGGRCDLDGTDLSGPPSSSISPDAASAILGRSIADINAALRGGLVLVNAGPAAHTDLCGKNSGYPIVIGWGTTPQAAGALSFGSGSWSAAGIQMFAAARVFVSDTYEFSCTGSPALRDLQHATTHELLHAIGIGHSQDQNAIMAPFSIACQSGYLLTADDQSALAALYSPTTDGDVRIATAPFFSADGQALTVFGGGDIEALTTIVTTSGASGAWVQGRDGTFRLLLAYGPAFMQSAFVAEFPQGITPTTVVMLIR